MFFLFHALGVLLYIQSHHHLRPAGSVTIDNKNYQRYMGELQLIKNPQTADARTNVVAMIDENEIKMLSYITPGRKFSLLLHE